MTTTAPVAQRRQVRKQPAADVMFEYDVAIVGLGYVGLPTALACFDHGSRVLAVDTSITRLEAIVDGHVDLVSTDRKRLAWALGDARFVLTTDSGLLARAAAIVICVPTPVDEHLVPDLSLLQHACDTVVRGAVEGQLLMLTSTTYVGCTEDLLVRPLVARGFTPGVDIHVAFSPERIDPGNDRFTQAAVPRVVGGRTTECRSAGAGLLRSYGVTAHEVPSLEVAEMSKLLENTFRAVNIALINEFADICTALRISVMDVIAAAATKPYGFMAFQPGPGVGGHCIPCDPHYLLWQLREHRVAAPVIAESMGSIAARPRHVVERVREVLGELGISVRAARVLVVGVTYKPDVDDLRESPALEILDGLERSGITVGFVDTHVTTVRLRSGRTIDVSVDPGAWKADVVLLHTRHIDTDLSWIRDCVVVDATYRSADIPNRVLL